MVLLQAYDYYSDQYQYDLCDAAQDHCHDEFLAEDDRHDELHAKANMILVPKSSALQLGIELSLRTVDRVELGEKVIEQWPFQGVRFLFWACAEGWQGCWMKGLLSWELPR